jgi:spermidine/putrescine transport system substrate-binding protein
MKGPYLSHPPMPRRRFAGLLAGSGLALVALFRPRATPRAQGLPVLYTWEGFDTPDLVLEFVNAHGGPPVFQTFAEEDEAFDNLRSGLAVDVAHPCADTFTHWNDAGLLQPIDVARLTNWDDVFEPLKRIPGSAQESGQLFIPIDWGTTSVAYRTDLVEAPEDSYAILWDERYAGRLSIGEDATETVIIAALAAGVPDPFNMTDADLGRVRELLERQKPLLKFYWSDATLVEEALSTGELVATSIWSDTFRALKHRRLPIRYMQPREGILSWCCGLVLTNSATEVDAAYELIDAMLAPITGVKWVERGSNHSNRKTYERIDEATLVEMGVPRDPTELLASSVFLRDYPRLADYQRMFDAVRGGD